MSRRLECCDSVNSHLCWGNVSFCCHSDFLSIGLLSPLVIQWHIWFVGESPDDLDLVTGPFGKALTGFMIVVLLFS